MARGEAALAAPAVAAALTSPAAPVHPALRQAVEARIGAPAAKWMPTGESGWAQTFSLQNGAMRYFVKVSRCATMLACEADGLHALGATETVRVPHVVAHDATGDDAWLVLEWLDTIAAPPARAFGVDLARLHRSAAATGPRGERFGWHRDNWLGATPQSNAWCDDWCAFFRERRLVPQLARAAANGFSEIAEQGARVVDALPSLLAEHAPAPSLVHGDLWSGNAAMLRSGVAVVFDPAVYVGDREVDIAMTELFGGFGAEFRRGYDETWPLDPGYVLRRDVYNLYHLLNHVNLFGSSYVARTRRTLSRLLEAEGH